MKAMKGMMGNLTRRGVSRTNSDNGVSPPEVEEGDTPEYNGSRAVTLFCESGEPNSMEGDEVLHLPVIVDAAESSPAAASHCAASIRKYLSKENFARPRVQYNALMLLRILTDNPGPTFTRNLDYKFVTTIKELLKYGRDPGVQHILRETLDSFEKDKVLTDENLAGIVDLWKKEQVKLLKMYPNGVPPGLTGVAQPRVLNAPAWDPQSQNYFTRNHNSRHLPSPAELSSRIEEAKTSAKLLGQVVQSTPPSELLQSELVKEFSDRCQSASRSIQKYMHAENPGPDNDTMLTLIETNDQLSQAMSTHQRAILQARKTLGLSASTTPSATPSNGDANPFAPPPGPPPSHNRKNGAPRQPPRPEKSNRSEVSAVSSESENPFNDPPLAGPSTTKTHNPPFPEDRKNSTVVQEERLGIEPYHPGFNAKSQKEKNIYADDDDSEEDSPVQQKGNTKAPVYRY